MDAFPLIKLAYFALKFFLINSLQNISNVKKTLHAALQTTHMNEKENQFKSRKGHNQLFGSFKQDFRTESEGQSKTKAKAELNITEYEHTQKNIHNNNHPTTTKNL
jgi:hypothetical protein